MLTYREQLIIEASKWTSDCESVLNDLVTRRTMIVSLKIGSFFKRLDDSVNVRTMSMALYLLEGSN